MKTILTILLLCLALPALGQPGYSGPHGSGYHQKLVYIHHHHDTGECLNELIDSHTFDKPTMWSPVSSDWTLANFIPDPFGGTTATIFTSKPSVTNVYLETINQQPGFVTGAEFVTFSGFFNSLNLGVTDRSQVVLHNTNTLADHIAAVIWEVPPVFSGVGVTAGGIVDLTGGWYRVWGSFDNTAAAADLMTVRLFPCTTPATPDAIMIAGSQLEFKRASPCGSYIIKD